MIERHQRSNTLSLHREVLTAKNDDDVPNLRVKSYFWQTRRLAHYDAFNRNNGQIDRSWKSHRKTQYKPK